MNDEKADTSTQTLDSQIESISEVEEATADAGSLDIPLAISDESGDWSNPCDSCKDPAEDQELLEDSLQDSDSSASLPGESDSQAGLEQLRSELNRLRAELAEKEAFWTRMGEECDEFRILYPGVSLRDLPDRVWEDAKRGIPIAAAYALAEKRRAYTEALAAESNRENQLRSTGALTGTENEYFSPGEVRAMSSEEVRANYQKIMRSMQKWR